MVVIRGRFHLFDICAKLPFLFVELAIGHVNEYPTMHYYGIPIQTQSMIAYKTLTEYFWKYQ